MERTITRTSNDTQPKQATSTVNKVNKSKTLVYKGGDKK